MRIFIAIIILGISISNTPVDAGSFRYGSTNPGYNASIPLSKHRTSCSIKKHKKSHSVKVHRRYQKSSKYKYTITRITETRSGDTIINTFRTNSRIKARRFERTGRK